MLLNNIHRLDHESQWLESQVRHLQRLAKYNHSESRLRSCHHSIWRDLSKIIRVQSDRKRLGQRHICFPRLDLRPRPRSHQLPDLRLLSVSSSLEHGFVDVARHLFSQLEVEKLLELRCHFLLWEDHECHGSFQCSLVFGICRCSRCELIGCKLDCW